MSEEDRIKRLAERLLEQRTAQEQQKRELREQEERLRKAAEEKRGQERADLDRLLSDIESKPDNPKP